MLVQWNLAFREKVEQLPQDFQLGWESGQRVEFLNHIQIGIPFDSFRNSSHA